MIYGENMQELKKRFDSSLQLWVRDGIKLKREKLTFCKADGKVHKQSLTKVRIEQVPERECGTIDMPKQKGKKAVSGFNKMLNYFGWFLSQSVELMRHPLTKT